MLINIYASPNWTNSLFLIPVFPQKLKPPPLSFVSVATGDFLSSFPVLLIAAESPLADPSVSVFRPAAMEKLKPVVALVLAGANTNGLLGAGSFLVSVLDASGVESCPKENVPGTEKKKKKKFI